MGRKWKRSFPGAPKHEFVLGRAGKLRFQLAAHASPAKKTSRRRLS